MQSSDFRPHRRSLHSVELLLKTMGIQPWYLRGSAPPAAASERPAAALVATDGGVTGTADDVPPGTPQGDPLAAAKAALRETPAPAIPEVSAQPSEPGVENPTPAASAMTDEPSAPVQQLAFTWVRGATGMVLAEPGLAATNRRLLEDIVAFGDWRRSNRRRPGSGEFIWPQLVGSSGSPQRAMTVFVDKHLPPDQVEGRWLAVFESVADQFGGWLEQLPVTIIRLPGSQASLGDAEVKKAIWRSMQSDA